MKKFSLRHNYNTIELLGPLQHLKISIDYGHVNHNAVYSEAYWFMRFLNKHWDFTSDSVKTQILQAAKQSNSSDKPGKAPVPIAPPDPPFCNDVLDPNTYEKLVKRLAADLCDRLPQPSTKLRHSRLVEKELGISHTTLWRWSKQGLLKTVKIYNVIYVDLDSFADLEKRARAGEFAIKPHGSAGDSISGPSTLSVSLPSAAQVGFGRDSWSGLFYVTLTGEAGWPYLIESSTNLNQWTPFVMLTPSTDGAAHTDSTPPNQSRFYRARRLP